MPIGESDYSRRSENLQKLAKLADKMGTEQDNRIIVEKRGASFRVVLQLCAVRRIIRRLKLSLRKF